MIAVLITLALTLPIIFMLTSGGEYPKLHLLSFVLMVAGALWFFAP